MTFSSLIVIPYTSLLPAIAKEMFHGDERTFSWFESAAGLGAMIGAFNMARLKSGTNLRYQVMGAAALMGVALLFLAHSSMLQMALVYVMLVSFAMMMQNSSINTYIQTHAIPIYRARAISYYVMAFQGIFPIGTLMIGSLASYCGLRTTLYVMGGLGILIAIVYYGYLRLHIHKRLFKF
ncbi:enterobactin exporter EntS [compost metagenome]